MWLNTKKNQWCAKCWISALDISATWKIIGMGSETRESGYEYRTF